MKVRQLSVEWDGDYGCRHARGWSVVVNGRYVVALERRLLVALWVGFREWLSIRSAVQDYA